MPQATFRKAEITAMHTVLGSELHRIDQDLEAFGGDKAQIERLKKMIGLNERRHAPVGITSNDLCFAAAQKLALTHEPDALLFVTQTPDHAQPCNAAILHGWMNYKESCAAMDINLGCSGWVYGLYIAYSMIESGGCDRILLLAGDTISQCVHPRDRSTASLFGDAGSATLIEKTGNAHPSYFSLHTRGKDYKSICIPAGGYRLPSHETTKVENVDDSGNTRTPENLFMDGSSVFHFAVHDEPDAIREICQLAEVELDLVDIFAFHQANRFVLSNIASRLKVPKEKVPMESVGRFGNLSSASIPGVLCDERADSLCNKEQNLLCSGFGVGFSWASMLQKTNPWGECSLSVYESK